ncbi:hypothetical protein N7453_001803 [Penicillium expansum]|nr:hypothetical protein N7453_001803 [Penicillium expansum]
MSITKLSPNLIADEPNAIAVPNPSSAAPPPTPNGPSTTHYDVVESIIIRNRARLVRPIACLLKMQRHIRSIQNKCDTMAAGLRLESKK